jgi:hypothetical protein
MQMLSLQLREQAIQQREEAAARSDDRMRRGQDLTDAQKAAALKQRGEQFLQREQRLEQALQLRSDTTWARLEQSRQQAEQKFAATQDRQSRAALEAAIKAQDAHVRTRIQAFSVNNTMSAKDRTEMLKQADKEFFEKMDVLKNVGGSKGDKGAAPEAAPATPAAPEGGKVPVKVKTPEEAQKLAPGTHYVTPDGQEFTR